MTSSVRAELSLALESRGEGAAAVARGVEEVALALGIDALLDRATHELSGGEKQRVALGAALAGRPQIVLLDEPTSQLDPVAGDELIGLLRRLNQEWETTVVLAEHRLERCLTGADRVIALDDGRDRLRRRPDAVHAVGQRARAGAADARPPSCSRCATCTRRPSASSRRARRCAAAACCRRRASTPSAGARRGAAGARAAPCAAPGGRAARRAARRRWRCAACGTSCATARRSCAASTSRGARRERRADGSQRRRQVDAAAPRRRAAGADARAASSAPDGWRCCCRTPATTSSTSASTRRPPPQALAAVGLSGDGRAPPARPLRRRAPAPGAGDRDRRARRPADAPAAVLALDEPTRGMDRQAKAELAAELRRRAGEGQAVIVATHDPEFAAACADRAVLLADGRVIADGPDARAARRRLVLRHRDGAHPRRRRRRAAARAGRRAAAPRTSRVEVAL